MIGTIAIKDNNIIKEKKCEFPVKGIVFLMDVESVCFDDGFIDIRNNNQSLVSGTTPEEFLIPEKDFSKNQRENARKAFELTGLTGKEKFDLSSFSNLDKAKLLISKGVNDGKSIFIIHKENFILEKKELNLFYSLIKKLSADYFFVILGASKKESKKYADVIVDGKDLNESTSTGNYLVSNSVSRNNGKLRFKDKLNVSWNSFTKSKGFASLLIVPLTISMSIAGIYFSTLDFNKNEALAKYCLKIDNNYLSVGLDSLENINDVEFETAEKASGLKFGRLVSNTNYRRIQMYDSLNSPESINLAFFPTMGKLASINDFPSYYKVEYGVMPQNYDEVMITDVQLKSFELFGYKDVNGFSENDLSASSIIDDPSLLIGKEINPNHPVKIVGIAKTNYDCSYLDTFYQDFLKNPEDSLYFNVPTDLKAAKAKFSSDCQRSFIDAGFVTDSTLNYVKEGFDPYGLVLGEGRIRNVDSKYTPYTGSSISNSNEGQIVFLDSDTSIDNSIALPLESYVNLSSKFNDLNQEIEFIIPKEALYGATEDQTVKETASEFFYEMNDIGLQYSIDEYWKEGFENKAFDIDEYTDKYFREIGEEQPSVLTDEQKKEVFATYASYITEYSIIFNDFDSKIIEKAKEINLSLLRKYVAEYKDDIFNIKTAELNQVYKSDEYSTYSICGIVNNGSSISHIMYASDNVAKGLLKNYGRFYSSLICEKPNDYRAIQRILDNDYKENSFVIYSSTGNFYNAPRKIEFIRSILLIIAVFFGIVGIAALIVFQIYSIKRNSSTINILNHYKTDKKQIANVFIIETLYSILISFVISLVISTALILFMNGSLSSVDGFFFAYLLFGFKEIGFVAIVAIVYWLIGFVYPILSTKKSSD